MGELNPMTLSCADLSARVLADGGTKVTPQEALSGPQPADGGHYIAALFRPQSSCDFPRCGPDFHFARRDADLRWSHKVGESAATDRDGSGQPITNPQVRHAAPHASGAPRAATWRTRCPVVCAQHALVRPQRPLC